MAFHAATTPFIGRQRLQWGASTAEAVAELPGDDLVPRPKWAYTYGVTIAAPIDGVWPWIAQIGQGRAGFYSYETLENLLGCEIVNATEILAEHQHPAVGDAIYLHPESPPLVVAHVDPPYALVLHGRPTPEASSVGDGSSTWQFCLFERDDGAVRLLVRGRSHHGPGWANRLAFGRFPMEPISYVMNRRMMLEIKRLAERGR